MSVPGFKSSPVFDQIKAGIEGLGETERKQTLKQVNGLFEIIVKNAEGKEQSWTLDLKNEGKVYAGKPEGKADIVINTSDDTFVQLADGKTNGSNKNTGIISRHCG